MADRIRSDAGAASRRRFIQQAGAGSAAVAAATLGLATQEAEAAQAFDASYDVVVCGSGCGGLASALFARWQGNSAVILEKAGSIGGTTAKAAFWYWVPNNEAMKKAGIADPKPDFLKYVARLSSPQTYDPAHPRLGLTQWEYDMCAAFYDSASPAAELLADQGCAALSPRAPTCPTTSPSCPRTRRPRAACWCRRTRSRACPTAAWWPCARCRPRRGRKASASAPACACTQGAAGQVGPRDRRRSQGRARCHGRGCGAQEGRDLRHRRLHPQRRAAPELPQRPVYGGCAALTQRRRLRPHRQHRSAPSCAT